MAFISSASTKKPTASLYRNALKEASKYFWSVKTKSFRYCVKGAFSDRVFIFSFTNKIIVDTARKNTFV